METLAKAIISAIYGSPPNEENSEYETYLLAVSEESKFLSKIENSDIIKKFSLGEYSEEHFENVSKDKILSQNAKILLDNIYDIRHVNLLK